MSEDLRMAIAAKHSARLLGRLPQPVEGNLFDADDVVIDVPNETWTERKAS